MEGCFLIISLLLIDAVFVVAAISASRLAQRIWRGEAGWAEAASLRTGEGLNETRLRIAAASLATAISIDSLALFGVLALIAGAIGRSTDARILLVLSALAGMAFLVFIGIAGSIYYRERPQKLIPPPFRISSSGSKN